MQALLSVKNLSVTYISQDGRRAPLKAVNDVSLDVHRQQSLGVVGESGSGKSTLMHAILRVLNPKTAKVSGSVYLDGTELLGMSNAELFNVRWKEMAVVFQKSMNALSPVHRIGAFMADIYKVHRAGATSDEAKKRVAELLAMVSLPERVARMYPHELSGGMMQRVSIALSLMFNPKLLIMDEATTALDVVTQTQILEEIRGLERDLELTRVMVTHDMSVVASNCDNVAIMYAGRMMESGPVKSVLVEPLHPYTRCLIESFPDFADDPNEELKSIGGSLPDLRNPVPGCVFAPRCPQAAPDCFADEPDMREYGKGRRAACHYVNGDDSGGKND